MFFKHLWWENRRHSTKKGASIPSYFFKHLLVRKSEAVPRKAGSCTLFRSDGDVIRGCKHKASAIHVFRRHSPGEPVLGNCLGATVTSLEAAYTKPARRTCFAGSPRESWLVKQTLCKKKGSVAINSGPTLFIGDRNARQPRRKERSSAQFTAREPLGTS